MKITKSRNKIGQRGREKRQAERKGRAEWRKGNRK